MKAIIRKTFLFFLDIILINVSFVLAFLVRFDGLTLQYIFSNEFFNIYFENAVAITILKLLIFKWFGLYRSLWKYASIEEFVQVVTTSLISTATILSYMFIMNDHLPRSIYILTLILDIILIGGLRFSYRTLRFVKKNDLISNRNKKRIMIVGAGEVGAMIIRELKLHSDLNSKPVAIIDDSPNKIGRSINGIRVLGNRYDIQNIAQKKRIDEIIIAIAGESKNEVRKIIHECNKTTAKIKIVPSVNELIDGKVSLKQLRDVKIEDLLGRESVKVNLDEMIHYLQDRIVLVTGGGGTIGSELCRQIAKFEPEKLLILDIYENNAFYIENELRQKHQDLNMEVIIASVRDKPRLHEIFSKYKPNVVFHAAAHKHVPLMESNPQEAIKNNVFGTLNVAECADIYDTDKFVLISTDKAVNPTNVMGATKRMAEMIIQAMSKKSKTEFVAVRFGNVLGSNGSVIPVFKKQIENGGPVTVTHEEVTRYFMTISEAVQLVIQAGAMAKGGEIFVLDMGEPMKIVDLAENLIRLSGFQPYRDIEIEFIGLRPGEKLYEELLMDEEGLEKTKHNKIFIGKPLYIDQKVLNVQLRRLKELIEEDSTDLVNYIEHMVPTYKRIS